MTNEFPSSSNSFADLAERAGEAIEHANTWLASPNIADAEEATAAADLVRLINDVLKDLEAARKAEVRPLDAAKAAIQARYRPISDRLAMAKEKVAGLLQGYLKRAQEAKRKEAAEAAAHAAAKFAAAKSAAEAAKTVEEAATAEEAAKKAAETMAAATALLDARARVESNAGDARAMTIRRGPVKVRITDLRAAAGWAFRHKKEAFAAAIEPILARAARDGVTGIPGIETYREEFVA